MPRVLAAAAMLLISIGSGGGGRFDGPLAAMQDGHIDRKANFEGNAWMAPSAAISPDGRYVSYIAPRTAADPGEVHVRDLVTGRASRRPADRLSRRRARGVEDERVSDRVSSARGLLAAIDG
jgi:hypothetical protein